MSDQPQPEQPQQQRDPQLEADLIAVQSEENVLFLRSQVDHLTRRLIETKVENRALLRRTAALEAAIAAADEDAAADEGADAAEQAGKGSGGGRG